MTAKSTIAILAVCATVTVVICVISSRRHGPAKAAHVNNLRQFDSPGPGWTLDDNELETMVKAKTNAMTFTNAGSLDQKGTRDYMTVKEVVNFTPKSFSAYVHVTGTWIQVKHPGWIKGSRLPEGEFVFPQRAPSGTPVARALSAGGKKVTHVFTNGVWLEVGEMPNGTPTNTTP